MVAYWIARAKINNPVEYKKYADKVPGILEKYQGKILSRGGDFQILEGPEIFERFVVIEFQSMAMAVSCFNSPEYLAAATFRRNENAGQNELVIVEAVEATPS